MTQTLEEELRGGNYLRINLVDQFISNVIDRIRPVLEVKRLFTFRNMDISGCMCKNIACDTTIQDLGIRLETEIRSFRRCINRYILVLEYEMIEKGKVNLVVRDQRIILGRSNLSYFKRP